MVKRTRDIDVSEEVGTSTDVTVIEYIISKTSKEFQTELERRLPPGFFEFLCRTKKGYVKENISSIVGLNGFPANEGSYQSWQRYLAAARIVYNETNKSSKRILELMARKKRQDVKDIAREPGTIKTEMSLVEDTDGQPDESKMVEMSRTEYGLFEEDDIILEEMLAKLAAGKAICPNPIYEECTKDIHCLKDLVGHLELIHPVCSLFVCTECNIAFTSKQFLMKHKCPLNKTSKMNFCVYIMVCKCCGQHCLMNIKKNDDDDLDYYRYFMIAHNSFNIRLIKMYSATILLPNSNIKLTYLPNYIKQVSSHCTTCDVNISSLSDLRAHSHSFEQTCCENKWTTHLDYIKHVNNKHLPKTASIANFLSQVDFIPLLEEDEIYSEISGCYINPIKENKHLPLTSDQILEILKLNRSTGVPSNRNLTKLKVYQSNNDETDCLKYMKKGYRMQRMDRLIRKNCAVDDITDNLKEDIYIKLQPVTEIEIDLTFKNRTIMCSLCTYITDNESTMDSHLVTCRQDLPEDERTTTNDNCIYTILDGSSPPNSLYICPLESCNTEMCSLCGLQIHLLQQHCKYSKNDIRNESIKEVANDYADLTRRVNLVCYLTAEGTIPDTGIHILDVADRAFDKDIFKYIELLPEKAKTTNSEKPIDIEDIHTDERPPKIKRRRVYIAEELETETEDELVNEAKEESINNLEEVRSLMDKDLLNCEETVITEHTRDIGAHIDNGTHISKEVSAEPQNQAEESVNGPSEDVDMKETEQSAESLDQVAESEAQSTEEDVSEDVVMKETEETTGIPVGSMEAIKMFKKTCPYCGLYFTKDKYLNNHIKLHPELSRDCKICKKQYDSLCDLYLHHTTEHVLEPPNDPTINYKNKVLCGVCQMTHYKTAVFSHQIYDCYMTTQCGICAEDHPKKKLAIAVSHMKAVHKNQYERFVCGCKKAFFHFSNYKSHECERTPVGGKCNVCKIILKSKNEATKHVNNKHAQFVKTATNRRQCQVCMRTVDSSSMISHCANHVVEPDKQIRLDHIRMDRNMLVKLNIAKHECYELKELLKQKGEESRERVVATGFVQNRITSSTDSQAEDTSNTDLSDRREKYQKPTEERSDKTARKNTEANERSAHDTTVKKTKIAAVEQEQERADKTPQVVTEIEDLALKGLEMNEPTHEKMEIDMPTKNDNEIREAPIEITLPKTTTHNENAPNRATPDPMEPDITQEDNNSDNNERTNVNSTESAVITETEQMATERPPAFIIEPTAVETPLEEDSTAADLQPPPSVFIIEPNSQRTTQMEHENDEIQADLQPPSSVFIIEPTQTTQMETDNGDYEQDKESGAFDHLFKGLMGNISNAGNSDEIEVIHEILNVSEMTELHKPMSIDPLPINENTSNNKQEQLTFKRLTDNDDEIEMAEEATISVKSHECPHCSLRFYNQKQLRLHVNEGHRFDSKDKLCSEFYGLPKKGIFYLCRLESTAFENYERFQQHMSLHNPEACFECDQCTAIAIQKKALEEHQEYHKKNSLVFRCTRCTPHVNFKEEHFLYEHLRTEHNASMIYFCKGCRLASLDWRNLFSHITNPNCGISNQKPLTVASLGITPATTVSYQPHNEEEYKVKVSEHPEEYLKLSVCSGHLFSRHGPSFTTCPEHYHRGAEDCFGLVNYLGFISIVASKFNNGIEITPFQLENLQPSVNATTPRDPYLAIKDAINSFSQQLPKNFNPNVAAHTSNVPYSSCAFAGIAPRPVDPRVRQQQNRTVNQPTQLPTAQNISKHAGAVNAGVNIPSTSTAYMRSPQTHQPIRPHNQQTRTPMEELLFMVASQSPNGINEQMLRQRFNGISSSQIMQMLQQHQIMNNLQGRPPNTVINNAQSGTPMMQTSAQQQYPINGQARPVMQQNRQLPPTFNQQVPPQQIVPICALCLDGCPAHVVMQLDEAVKLIVAIFAKYPPLFHCIQLVPDYTNRLIHELHGEAVMKLCYGHFQHIPSVQPGHIVNSSCFPPNILRPEDIVIRIRNFMGIGAQAAAAPVNNWNAQKCCLCDRMMNERSMITLDPTNSSYLHIWPAIRKNIIDSAHGVLPETVLHARKLPQTLDRRLHFCIKHVNPCTITIDETGHLRYVSPPAILYCDYSIVVVELVPDASAMIQHQNRLIQTMNTYPVIQKTYVRQLLEELRLLRETNRCKSELCKHAFLRESSEERLFHEMHLSQNLFTCIQCNTKVKNEKSLVEHMINKHNLDPNRKIEYKLRCPLLGECGVQAAFESIPQLRKHMNTVHSNKLKYRSNFCASQFHNEQMARNHEMEHAEEEFHCCYLCGLTGEWQRNLHSLAHCITRKSHIGCQICCEKFTTEVDLFKHFRSAHVINKNGYEECVCKARGESITSVHIQETHKLAFASVPDNYVVELSPTFQYWLGLG